MHRHTRPPAAAASGRLSDTRQHVGAQRLADERPGDDLRAESLLLVVQRRRPLPHQADGTTAAGGHLCAPVHSALLSARVARLFLLGVYIRQQKAAAKTRTTRTTTTRVPRAGAPHGHACRRTHVPRPDRAHQAQPELAQQPRGHTRRDHMRTVHWRSRLQPGRGEHAGRVQSVVVSPACGERARRGGRVHQAERGSGLHWQSEAGPLQAQGERVARRLRSALCDDALGEEARVPGVVRPLLPLCRLVRLRVVHVHAVKQEELVASVQAAIVAQYR